MINSGYILNAPKVSVEQAKADFDAIPVEEKYVVLRDLYGIDGGNSILENETIITTGLEQMQQCIVQIPCQEKEHYNRAVQVGPDYVNDREIQLQFLRCELYNAKNAAIRYVNYFKYKANLWGEDCAYRKITIKDFTEDDHIALNRGGFQFVNNTTDKFGRGIILCNRLLWDLRQNHRQSMLRFYWYIMESAIENVQVQKNGIVFVANLGPRQPTLHEEDRKLDRFMIQLYRDAIPIRIVAMHHFISSRLVNFIVPYLLFLIGDKLRSRFVLHLKRPHVDLDVRELEEYGFERQMLPHSVGGTNPFTYRMWLQRRISDCN